MIRKIYLTFQIILIFSLFFCKKDEHFSLFLLALMYQNHSPQNSSLNNVHAVSSTASVVYGQNNDFTTNQSGIAADKFQYNRGLVVDSSGNLYVADFGASRVTYHPSGGTIATDVYGQSNLTTGTANSGGLNADSLNQPSGVALDSSGNLYIADSVNNRVLYYESGSTTATRVYGQPNMTSNTANNGGISANSLNSPRSVALDRSGNLYISDFSNHRVLYYASGSTTATRVYGQPNMTSNTANNGGLSESTLNSPQGIAVDSNGNLYVSDSSNYRVLYFTAGSTSASRVYGQPNYNSNTDNNGGISASSLSYAISLTLDSGDNVYIADTTNNRILFFENGKTTANTVYGQNGSFTSGTANNGGRSATSLNFPEFLHIAPNKNLYVSDISNRRVVVFPY